MPSAKKKSSQSFRALKRAKKVRPPISKKKRSFRKRLPRKKSPVVFQKNTNNPIITPIKENAWEVWQTFNSAAVLIGNKVHFLYRAIGNDGISRFGHANSTDGFALDERHPVPVYQDSGLSREYVCYSLASGGSWGGCEDPRICHIGEDSRIYLTYTSCSDGLRVGLSSIKVEDFLNKNWNWSPPRLISPPDEVHKNWVIFPEKINGKYAILHSISPKISIEYRDDLDFSETEHIQSHYHPGDPAPRWDSYLRGAGPTPLKTKRGWLLFYHAMNHDDVSQYKVGAMLLDLQDPTKILHRSQKPILVPSEYYELKGFKPGVVYVLGAIIKNGDLILYYGGADNYVCAAHANLTEFLGELTKPPKKQTKKILKVRKRKT